MHNILLQLAQYYITMQTIMDFSEAKFLSLISKKGYRSIKEFAEKNNLNRNTIHNYLRGQSVFTTQFGKILNILKCCPLDLLEENTEDLSFDWKHSEISDLISTIIKEFPHIGIFLIGSRASKRALKYSDWDIALTCLKKNLSIHDISKIINSTENITDNLARKVDFVNLDKAPIWFLSSITSNIKTIGGNELAIKRFLYYLKEIKNE